MDKFKKLFPEILNDPVDAFNTMFKVLMVILTIEILMLSFILVTNYLYHL